MLDMSDCFIVAQLATHKNTASNYKRWRKEIERRISKLKGKKGKDITSLLKAMKKM